MATSEFFLQRTPPSFEEFILQGPASLNHTITSLSYVHFVPQSTFLFDENGCPGVDFIGHLESFDCDMMYILNVLNIPELWSAHKKYGFRGHAGNDPNIFGTKYKAKHAISFTHDMLRSLYEREHSDFTKLGYQISLHHETPMGHQTAHSPDLFSLSTTPTDSTFTSSPSSPSTSS
jgi:hypothetical protein